MEISKGGQQAAGGDEAKRLSAENEYLRGCLKQAASQQFAMRLDSLFRVIESKAFEGTDFYQECRDEIMYAMRLKDEDKKKVHDAVGESR